MKIGDLNISISCDASGYCRGYYEIDEVKLYKYIERFMDENEFDKNNEKDVEKLTDYLTDDVHKFLGEFIMVRNDMNKDISVEVE